MKSHTAYRLLILLILESNSYTKKKVFEFVLRGWGSKLKSPIKIQTTTSCISSINLKKGANINKTVRYLKNSYRTAQPFFSIQKNKYLALKKYFSQQMSTKKNGVKREQAQIIFHPQANHGSVRSPKEKARDFEKPEGRCACVPIATRTWTRALD